VRSGRNPAETYAVFTEGSPTTETFSDRRAAVMHAESSFKRTRRRTRVVSFDDGSPHTLYALYPNRGTMKRRSNPGSMWTNATRYIGNARIVVGWNDSKSWYDGYVKVGKLKQTFSDLHPPRVGFGSVDSAEAYDRIAVSIVSFLSYYTTGNRGDDVPDWAPPADFADALENEVGAWMDPDGRGLYYVRRSKRGKGRWVG
jgi:hypothetical protein